MALKGCDFYGINDGGSGIIARRVAGQAGSDEYVSKIPNNKVCKGVVCTHMIYVMYLVL